MHTSLPISTLDPFIRILWMVTSISCPRQPAPSVISTEETTAGCSGSSSEDDYHDLIELNCNPLSPAFPHFTSGIDAVGTSQLSQISGSKRYRYQKSSVSAVDLIRAAKMAQAAGREQGLSRETSRHITEASNNAEKPYLATHVHQAAAKPDYNEVRPATERIYSATSARADARTANSADLAKLGKAFHTVDTMAVVGRLCRVDGILPDLALHVIYEYLRFLILLIRCQDWNAAMLWPSPMVDLAWRQHVLDTIRYLSDCQSICGRFIHYNPDAELGGQELCKMKYSRTLALYRSVFGEPPQAIWPIEHDLIPNPNLAHQNPQLAAVNAVTIQLQCRIPSGATAVIEVNMDDTVGQIFNKLRNWENVGPISHILVYNGDILDVSTELNKLELRDGVTVDIIPAVNSR